MHEIEIIVILWMQSLGDWLKPFMLFFSFLGSQTFYLFCMAFLYWCVDIHLGIWVGLVALISNGFATGLKWFFHSPRPYWINQNVQAISIASSYGFPSGHALTSSNVFGRITIWLKKNWLKAIFLFIILLIGISRIYLGIHFISDVLAGWLFGAALLFSITKLEILIKTRFKNIDILKKLIIAVLSSLLIIMLFIFLKQLISNFQIPAEWIKNITKISPGLVIPPISLDGTVSLAGSWFGMLVGFFWISKIGSYNISGNFIQRSLRMIIGFWGIFILSKFSNLVLPKGELFLNKQFLIYWQNFFIYLWIFALAPILFIKIGLTKT